MNTLFPLLSLLAVHAFDGDAAAQDTGNTAPLQLTGGRVSANRLMLSWTGGRASYQVQTRSSFDQDWSNVGEPTASNSAELPLEANHGFFRVLSDYTARYEVAFDATWSEATHPQDWPAPGHWSGLVGAVHNADVSFFKPGETASEGIRLMAERGQQDPLLNEVAPALQAGTAQFTIRGAGIGVSPGAIRLTFPEPMRRDHPLVTLCSMVAPSPDWFVGVSGLSLLANGEWAKSVVAELYPYDAGTDSGVTFRSPDEVTTPRGMITHLTGFPVSNDANVVVLFGTFTFTRLD